MVMLKDVFQQKEHIQSISDGLRAGLKEQLLTGLSGSAKPLFLSSLLNSQQTKSIIVTHKLMHAQQLYDDINECMNGEKVFLYPVNELIASEMAISSPELMAERIHGLTSWLQSENGTIIVPVAALKRKLPPITYWKKYRLKLHVDNVVDIKSLFNTFVGMGYERVEMVTTPGEFSMRGGIIDIYTMTEQNPIRIELFDDEIESIRTFDADTQRSIEEITSAQIMPATELLLTKENYLQAASRLEKVLSETLKKMTSANDKEKLWHEINEDIENLKQGTMFQGIYKYNDLFYENPASLLDYVSSNDLIILDELSRIQETAKFLDEEEIELMQSLLEKNQIVSHLSLSYDWLTIREKMNQQKIYMSLFLKHVTGTQPENVVNVSSHQMQEFHGQIDLFKSELLRWQNADYSIVILARNKNRLEKVKNILKEYDIETMTDNGVELPIKQPLITTGNLSGGIELPTYKLAIITENELFKKQKTRVRKNTRISNAERIKHYQELNVGDYVVHRSHGIGKYIGIESMEIAGLQKDFLLIKYSGNDKLYVPTDQLNLIQKYVGSEGKEPRLFKLGGTEWAKVKRKVQSSVEDIADELIKLYAERQARKGYAFDKDNELQADFEQAFTYQETPDQLRSVEEIKADMEKPSPMDRLLCGDVGYGKTEVAIRAMFKAILEGKQVAVLVPTTILAQQHFQTMKERFQEYPIKIGLLSRFRTKKQQSETLDELKEGTVDVVIGTHRMLSKDVHFKDLGLLVVDEEQRFGVKHKERIEQLKTNVDVLTLTATPIPRTLHMSMLGIRDLSVIETPPENRFPIQTYVMEQNRTFIKEAIEREISRGGQVYLLYNRIQNIEKIAQEIERLVDHARVSVAHGRMNENQLENVMFNFLEGESDVLVSTTIIETGVDIPNVNTLIVYDADRMGLSQLYQLRGRVGRSNRIAYAYFMYEKDKIGRAHF